MMISAKILASCFVVTCIWLVLACGLAQPSGEAKFVTQGQLAQHLNRLSLLQHVHTAELVIGYAFADNSGCSNRYTDSKVQSDMSKVLNVWLESLRGWSGLVASKGAVVSKFSYVKGSLLDSSAILQNTDHYAGKFPSDENTQEAGAQEIYIRAEDTSVSPILWVLFACREGRSMYRYYVLDVPNPPPATILQLDKELNGGYSLATLTHEIGHAFGLHDTYVGHWAGSDGAANQEGNPPTLYNESDCGADEIIGCQPLAVMNITHWLLAPNEVRIAADDIAGIRYVYRDIHADEKSCPADYTHEQTTSGCKPEHPLVFAIMNGDLLNAEVLIKSEGLSGKSVADLINTQDDKGHTFLHYAALRSASHGREMYRWLLEKGADPSITNKDGDKPVDLLLPQIEQALNARNTRVAQSLVSQALAD